MLKNKRILLTILVALLLLLIPSMVKATDEVIGSSVINGITVNWTYELDESNQIVNLKCTNVADLTGSFSIPSTIDGKSVVSIGTEAFNNATGITEVIIPDTVKTIEYNAFKNCTSLSSVDLGSIEGISFGVFKGCTSLKEITIPKTLKNAAVEPVFTDCTNLTKITLEEGLTVIPSNLCATTGITEIVVPSSVKTIETGAFENCKSLSNVDLGNIEGISFGVFKGCTSLKEITIPKTLKNAAVEPVFTNCTNLTKITLEDGLTIIPTNLCATTGITEIVVPDTVKTIEYSAFENCASLSNVDLGSIESISFDVFKGCTSLKEIRIPKTLKNAAVAPTFTNCTNLTKITFEEGLTVIPGNLCSTTGITEVVVPNSVKEIGSSAFENCKSLDKITILDGVTGMGWYTLYQDEDTVFQGHNENLTIYCYEGSLAAEYAINTKIKYVYLERPVIENENPQEENEEKPKVEEVEKEEIKKEETIQEEKKDNTIAPGTMPYTGGTFAVIISLLGFIILGVYTYKRSKDLKGI